MRGVGEVGDGHAHEGVEQRERQAVQQAELGIAQLQVGLDRFDHQGQDLPVNEREDVGHHAQDDHIPFVQVTFLGVLEVLRFGQGIHVRDFLMGQP